MPELAREVGGAPGAPECELARVAHLELNASSRGAREAHKGEPGTRAPERPCVSFLRQVPELRQTNGCRCVVGMVLC